LITIKLIFKMITISSFKSIDREQISISFFEIELESLEEKMKIILLVAILCLFSVNSLPDQAITCKVGRSSLGSQSSCVFFDVTIEQNENVSIKTDPEDTDARTIQWVAFFSSSIYSVPPEIFTKFPNLRAFEADGQNIQEIKEGTFKSATELEYLDLAHNKLAVLHVSTF
jgi:hypothetical protein